MSRYSRNTPYSSSPEEPCYTAGSREKDEGEKGGRGHLRRIEDFYTPFVDSDRRIPRRPCVSLPKLYCRKVDFTLPLPRPSSASSFSSSVLLWGEKGDNIARTREHPAHGCPSQDSREPIVPLAPSFLLACVMRAIHCTRVVNACIFLN